MATRFEVFLVGDDDEHLTAVGEAALDEVTRVERLLSRFDPASEVSRINRDAARHPVRVDRELFALLSACRAWSDLTEGYFDPCATGLPGSPRYGQSVELDEETRSVRFLDPATRLDFGAIGKGYALDVAAGLLDEFGVESALLHGGTSSILARGRSAWRVGLREPFWGSLVEEVELSDHSLSSSAAFDPGSEVSDIVDPISARSLSRQAACSVIAPTALQAEVLSTALLSMGKDRAVAFLARFSRNRTPSGIAYCRKFTWRLEADFGLDPAPPVGRCPVAECPGVVEECPRENPFEPAVTLPFGNLQADPTYLPYCWVAWIGLCSVDWSGAGGIR